MKKIFLLSFINILFLLSPAQKVLISGIIKNNNDEPLPSVIVRAPDFNLVTQTDPNGFFTLKLPQNKKVVLIFSGIGFSSDTLVVNTDKSKKIEITLKNVSVNINPIYTSANTVDESGIERFTTTNIKLLPDVAGNPIETMLKTGMGVSSNNELSSQYNVRGGSFDENLVYINGIEIYRPFLIHSAQQEGMSIINADLVSSIKFSAGGFGAEYDDKMSSVLDIRYKTPEKFEASFDISMLNSKAYIGNRSKDGKLTYLAGIRYQRSSYLFNTFEVKGDYKPNFTDFQSFTTYKITPNLSLSLFNTISLNNYIFSPTVSTSDFGSFMETMKMTVAYDGNERDRYFSTLNALQLNFKASSILQFKISLSSYMTQESEKYDILASYWLNEAAQQTDSTHQAGDSILNLGIGAYLNHARNYLNANFNEISIKASYNPDKFFIQAGIKLKNENIIDYINEWKYIDSAGFSINPQYQYPQDSIIIYKSTRAHNKLTTNRLSFYLQNSFTLNAGLHKLKFKAGLRASYNDYNHQFLLSPRFSMLLKPYWNKKWYFRFSTGYYYQPPFYNEIRTFSGQLVKDRKAQRSIHFVIGAYRTMKIWQRPFKFSVEAYYKKLDFIIPYEMDNMKIQYYADQTSHGYATGIDMKLYGEFVKGTDSWVSLSVMKTAEDIENDFYYVYYDKDGNLTNNRYEIVDTSIIYPGYIPRPSDQRVKLGIYFQDYVPGNQNIKVNMTYYFGTPLPFGIPEEGRYKAVLRSAYPYIRADIGFSFLLKSSYKNFDNFKFLNNFQTVWLQINIYNFMGIRNIVGYNWVTIVPNTGNPLPVNYDAIAVPNRLTGRLLNIKLIFRL